jgi:hypothetical protein
MDTPVLGLVGDIGKTAFLTSRTVTGMQLHVSTRTSSKSAKSLAD